MWHSAEKRMTGNLSLDARRHSVSWSFYSSPERYIFFALLDFDFIRITRASNILIMSNVSTGCLCCLKRSVATKVILTIRRVFWYGTPGGSTHGKCPKVGVQNLLWRHKRTCVRLPCIGLLWITYLPILKHPPIKANALYQKYILNQFVSDMHFTIRRLILSPTKCMNFWKAGHWQAAACRGKKLIPAWFVVQNGVLAESSCIFDLALGCLIWPYWRRTWPPSGNALRQCSPRPKFGSKGCKFNTRMPKGVILTPCRYVCSHSFPKSHDSNKIFGDFYSFSDPITTFIKTLPRFFFSAWKFKFCLECPGESFWLL